jgi:hypothetical protein
LEQVARLLDLYGAAGLTARDVGMSAVRHGEGDKGVRSAAAYADRFMVAPHPSLPLSRNRVERAAADGAGRQAQVDRVDRGHGW